MNDDDWEEDPNKAQQMLREKEISHLENYYSQEGYREGLLQQSDILENQMKSQGFSDGYKKGYEENFQQGKNYILSLLGNFKK